MAFTVVSKPSGLQPVLSGSLIYKFNQSTIPVPDNYRLEIELNGLNLPKFEFRPAIGTFECDIAAILRSKFDIENFGPGDFAYADRILSTYVKYQEKWSGGSNAQQSLSSDVIYFYYGANHDGNYRPKLYMSASDGNANKLLANGPFLHPLHKQVSNDHGVVRGWVNRRMFIECLHDNTLDNTVLVNVYRPDGTLFMGSGFFHNGFSMESTPFIPDEPGMWEVRVSDAAGTTFYGHMQILVQEECANPIHLRWVADTGGVVDWVFDYNQDVAMPMESLTKYQEKVCFADIVNDLEFKMLDELNRLGVVYNDRYKVGQVVYQVVEGDAIGNPEVEPVVIIPIESRTRTKSPAKSIQIRVRNQFIPNNAI